MSHAKPRIVVVNASSEDCLDYQCLLAADGWAVDTAQPDADPILRSGGPAPIVLLHTDPPTPATALIVQCLQRAAREIPVIATGIGLAPRRREMIRDLGLHGVWDVGESPEQLLDLVESAASRLARAQPAHENEDENLDVLLVGKLCHDLRGALHAIRGYSEMLDPEDPGVDFTIVRERLGSLSRDALDIAANYLELARIGETEDAAPAPVRIEALLADLQELAASRIGGRPITLSAVAEDPAAVIQTDELRLRAVLRELLANAIKFAGGRVSLAASSGKGYAEFRVTDDGSGIHGTLPRGIGPFKQAESSLLSTTPGEGIGLAMALRLTEQIGGTLCAETASSGGTSFRLVVPAGDTREATVYH